MTTSATRFDAATFLGKLLEPGAEPDRAATAEPLDLACEPGDIRPDDLLEHWRERYEERCGIMEFDANMTRQDAVRFALADIVRLMRAADEL